MIRKFCLIVIFALASVLPAWSQEAAAPPPADDPVVATFDGNVVHRSDIEGLYRSTPEAAQVPFSQAYEPLLNDMINKRLLYAEAEKAGMRDNPMVKEMVEVSRRQHMYQVFVEEHAKKTVTEAVMRLTFQKYIEKFPEFTEVNLHQIHVQTEEEARKIIAALDGGADFAQLAEKQNKADGVDTNGDRGGFLEEQLSEALGTAVKALKVGQYSKEPVQTNRGWHVIKVAARKKAPPPTLEDVRPIIFDIAARNAVEQLLKGLRAGAGVTIYNMDGTPVQ